jgi:hypothetical protein
VLPSISETMGFFSKNTDPQSSLTEFGVPVHRLILLAHHRSMVYVELHTWIRVALHRLSTVVLYVAVINVH